MRKVSAAQIRALRCQTGSAVGARNESFCCEGLCHILHSVSTGGKVPHPVFMSQLEQGSKAAKE